MRLFILCAAVFAALGTLAAGCATTCDTLQMKKKTLADGRALIVWKCGDKTVEAKVKQLPACLGACFDGDSK